MNMIELIRGTTFQLILRLPSKYADGAFYGYALRSQVRTEANQLVADLDAQWMDSPACKNISLRFADTSNWPVGLLVSDVKLFDPLGDESVQTKRIVINCIPGVTE